MAVVQAVAVRTVTGTAAPNTACSNVSRATASRSWPRGGRSGRLAAAATERTGTAEERLEDVAETSARERVTALCGACDPGLAEAVVPGALVRVAEHLVGLAQRLELLGGVRVGVGVGVQVAGRRRYAFFSSSALAWRPTPSNS